MFIGIIKFNTCRIYPYGLVVVVVGGGCVVGGGKVVGAKGQSVTKSGMLQPCLVLSNQMNGGGPQTCKIYDPSKHVK